MLPHLQGYCEVKCSCQIQGKQQIVRDEAICRNFQQISIDVLTVNTDNLVHSK